jgi:hypothetical protein
MVTSEFQVNVNGAGLGGAAPSDGFIDPQRLQDYNNNLLATGTTFGTVAIGDVFMLNNSPVTIVTGTTVADVVIDINNLSQIHHAVASVTAGKLSIINEALYTSIPVSVCDGSGTPGITAELGFDAPTYAAQVYPTTLAQSEAKVRANLRWMNMMLRLSQTLTINKIHGVIVTGGTLYTVDPTAIQFNVVLDTDFVTGFDLNGDPVFGILAVQNAVAQSLMDSDTLVYDVYDPTNNIPSPPPTIPINMSAYTITFGALTTTPSDALTAVTVVPVV